MPPLSFAGHLFMVGFGSPRLYSPSALHMKSFMRERSEAVEAFRTLRKLHQFVEERRVVVPFKLEVHPHHVLAAGRGGHDHAPIPSTPTFATSDSLAISVFAYSTPASWKPFTFAYNASFSS